MPTIPTAALIIAFIDGYKLLMIATLVVFPLLLLFRRVNSSAAHAMAFE